VAPHAYQADGSAMRTLPVELALAGPPAIVFAPDGSSSGGQIAVQDGYGSRRMTIIVDWLTGRVHVAETE
jgi:hypothetical protein